MQVIELARHFDAGEWALLMLPPSFSTAFRFVKDYPQFDRLSLLSLFYSWVRMIETSLVPTLVARRRSVFGKL